MHKKILKIHCGCGNNYKKGWINIDIAGKYDVLLDLRRKTPFLNNSVDFVYSEHFLEHLSKDESLIFLKEVQRILKPNGVIRIGVPDTGWAIRNYLKGPQSPWIKMIKKNNWQPVENVTPLDYLNTHFRQGGEHKYAYDFITLSSFLRKAHFKNIKRSKYKKYIDSWTSATLFVEANKSYPKHSV